MWHLRESRRRGLLFGACRWRAGAHVIQKNLRVLSALGIDPSKPSSRFARVSGRRRCCGRARGGARRFALINPGAAWPNKRWPPDRFGELAHRIQEEQGLPSYVLWGRGEESLADAVVSASRGAAVRAPRRRSVIC